MTRESTSGTRVYITSTRKCARVLELASAHAYSGLASDRTVRRSAGGQVIGHTSVQVMCTRVCVLHNQYQCNVFVETTEMQVVRSLYVISLRSTSSLKFTECSRKHANCLLSRAYLLFADDTMPSSMHLYLHAHTLASASTSACASREFCTRV